MSFTEKMLQSCAAYFEGNEKRSFRARVFDRDGKLLASGLGLLEEDKSQGTFWPDQDAVPEETLLSAGILKQVTGRQLTLREYRKCLGINTHYHFHYEE